MKKNQLPAGAVLSLYGEEQIVQIKCATTDDALDVFEWLRKVAPREPAGPNVNRTGTVITPSGVQKVGGMSQMVVGGATPGTVVASGTEMFHENTPAEWIDVETANEKTFRFQLWNDVWKQVDGPRRFEFDEGN